MGRIKYSKGRISAGSNSGNYLRVNLRNIRTETFDSKFVHRLVIEAFRGKNDELQVNHIDGNGKKHNR